MKVVEVHREFKQNVWVCVVRKESAFGVLYTVADRGSEVTLVPRKKFTLELAAFEYLVWSVCADSVAVSLPVSRTMYSEDKGGEDEQMYKQEKWLMKLGAIYNWVSVKLSLC